MTWKFSSSYPSTSRPRSSGRGWVRPPRIVSATLRLTAGELRRNMTMLIYGRTNKLSQLILC
jgi:hypothetical protein